MIALKNSNENLRHKVKKLNGEVSKTKAKAKKESIDIQKDFKVQVKFWKKELGEERSQKIRLEKKLKELNEKNEVKKMCVSGSDEPNSTDTTSLQTNTTKPPILEVEEDKIVSTICAEPISKYIPKFFLGEEINPACDDCKDSSIDSEVDTENETFGPG